MRQDDELPDTCFIRKGAAMRVRWMRHQGEFPARSFLERQFPEDIPQFLQRAREMANFGRIRLRSNGHQLGGRYGVLHQFNLTHTRSWGVRDGNVYVVVNAGKKRTTGQEPDYERSLELANDYFEGRSRD